uniref:t-SNARE coiled-coil homology domain-containing protein n=1 Tax=Pyrodinium bahamense TaxID=73915 RepID=A0A7S0AHN8_9DINO
MSGPPPVVRNLTLIYTRAREKSRGGSRGRQGFGDGLQGQRLLACDVDTRASGGEVAVEMAPLPPQWLECAKEAQKEIDAIRAETKLLTKAQERRKLNVFGDDTEVEAVSGRIPALIRRCEQQIHQVKTRGAGCSHESERDRELRKNMQRKLATQLQQLSQSFRQSQKDYLSELKKQQCSDVHPSSVEAGEVGFSDTQMQEVESMELNATQRSEEICRISSSINELHTVFKELAVLVIEQGSILDRIDYNIDQVVVQSKEANVQLQKAESNSKSNRAMKCIFLLVTLNLVMIIILIVKSRNS